MRTILFYIPHEVAGLTVFGAGWMLLLWAIGAAGLLWWLSRSSELRKEIPSYLPVLALLGGAIYFILPRIEERVPPLTADGVEVILGLPVRGYGVMLLLAVVSGIGVSAYRARRMGIDPEHVFSLAFWMFLSGIGGARLAYVLQYWPQFQRDSLGESLVSMLNITQGGLVVYGALLAVVPVSFLYLRRARLPVLAMADLIAPGMVLGLAIGRIGCFLHGCCYGGVCTLPWGVTFPEGPPRAPSPPYAYEWSVGAMYGFRLELGEHQTPRVAWVEPASAAEAAGLTAGQTVSAVNGREVKTIGEAREVLSGPLQNPVLAAPIRVRLTTADGRDFAWTVEAIPPRTPLPLHPTQIYASVSAFLLFGVLWFFYPFRRRDGEVFAMFLVLSPLSRFLEEVIRDDEGTYAFGMTISQNTSVLLMLFGVGLWAYIARQTSRPAWPPRDAIAGQG